jgi:putative tryptophan/tyrosine transport system substrate-binding protein
MRRREFIAGLGSAAAWPLVARAQQPARMRRIGVVMNLAVDDPEGPVRVAAFAQGLQEHGWSVGVNIRINYYWAAGDIVRARRLATEVVAQPPDVVLATGALTVGPLQEATRTVPIVFVQVTDPVGSGFVASLGRPGGNTTGFSLFEYGMAAKWLELLKQIAPRVTRVAVVRDATNPSSLGQLGALRTAAPSLGVELIPIAVRDAGMVERDVTAFVRGPNDGMIVLASAAGAVHRDLIIALAARHLLPAVYPFRYYVTSGGLISYGFDTIDPFRRAASYVDRILRGEKPADLPVQAPVKYETVINLKTAKALGLEIPPTLLATADEVIE